MAFFNAFSNGFIVVLQLIVLLLLACDICQRQWRDKENVFEQKERIISEWRSTNASSRIIWNDFTFGKIYEENFRSSVEGEGKTLVDKSRTIPEHCFGAKIIKLCEMLARFISTLITSRSKPKINPVKFSSSNEHLSSAIRSSLFKLWHQKQYGNL